MKFVLRIFMVLVLALMLAGCGSKKRIVTKKKNVKTKTERVVIDNRDSDLSAADDKNRDTAPIITRPKPSGSANSSEIYIATYSAIAQKKMRQHNIPASITLAQGILESGSGKGRLAIEGNNHFGIKCHNWTGDKIYHDDDATQECFRKYKYAEQSFDDHSEFLTSRSRYSKLFELETDDYKGWAKGLRAAGYATDRKYPDKLIDLIERLELYKFDDEVIGKSTTKPKSSDIARNQTHKVEKGDTMYSLSKRYNISIEELQQRNGMSNNNLQLGQILIIK